MFFMLSMKFRSGLLALLMLFCLQNALARQTKPYRGAEYRTKASYLYGRFEVRMKSSGGSGMLCSFFTYHDPPRFSLADWNEIDIEILGRYNDEVQFNTITAYETHHVQSNTVPFNPHHAFHVYAFEWTPDYVAWFVDGYEVFRDTGEHIATLNRPQKIMMNIWQPIWLDWVGALDPNRLPVYGYYDWIRYSRYTPGAGDNFTLEWTEALDSWNTSRWDKATHTWNGNNANFIHDNAVFKDGYLILCLTTPEATGYSGGVIVDLDVDAPSVVWAHAEEKIVDVYFSEAVEAASAESTANYIIPGVEVTAATLQADLKTVKLGTEGLDRTQSNLLVVSNIRDRSPSAHKMGVQQTRIANGLAFPVTINIGGAATATALADSTWDFYKEYGVTGGTKMAIAAGTVANANGNAAIYESAISGLTLYQVRLPSGRYDLTLMLAETEQNSSQQRVFDVMAEGETVVDDLDIYAQAGKSAAYQQTISDISVPDGILDLYFKPEKGVPILSGLHIVQRATTGIEQHDGNPQQFGLHVYPNPFNPSTNLTYSLQKSGHVRLALYAANGRLLRSLVDSFQPAGEHRFLLQGNNLSTGIYFIRMLVDGQQVESQKLAFLK